MNLETISVVVPTCDRAERLERCLAAIGRARRRVRAPVEVVVVDDASSDGTRAVLAHGRRSGLVDVVRGHGRRRGPSAARNTGWRTATGALVAFTDDDVEVDPNWLDALATALREAPPDVAGVGGRVVPAATDLVSSYMTVHRVLEPPESLRYLVTANCMFRRAALERVDGFDEKVAAPGGEDWGVCLALGDAGYRFAYEARAVVTHHYRPGMRALLKTFYRYGKGYRIALDS